MKKIAVVGLGKWGKLLIEEFSKISDVSICLGTGNNTNKKWLKSNFPKIHYTTNFDEILFDTTIDAVVIASPIHSHFELALRTLKSNKHVFVEKPLAQNPSESQILLNLAKKKKLSIFVGHIFLYHKVFKKILKLLKNDQLQFAKFEWNKFGTFNENILLNLATHELALVFKLFGNPQKIKISNSFGIFTASDMLSINLLFDKHRNCQLDINRISHEKKKIVSLITKNNTYVWSDNDLFKLNKNSMRYNLIFHSKILPLHLECLEFLQCVDRKQIDESAIISLHVLKILEIFLKKALK